MSHVTNRLEDHWSEVLPVLKAEWPALSDSDFEYIDREFDRLVEVIRERHGGRANIIQEAAIRDRINRVLREF